MSEVPDGQSGAGWPDVPGVPLNAGRSGYHWLVRTDFQALGPAVWSWRAREKAWRAGGMELTPEEMAIGHAHIGPCLTPAEHATHLRAAVDAAVAAEREACIEAIRGEARVWEIAGTAGSFIESAAENIEHAIRARGAQQGEGE